MAIVFFMEPLTANTTSAKYGMSRETIRMSVLRAKIRKLFIPVVRKSRIRKIREVKRQEVRCEGTLGCIQAGLQSCPLFIIKSPWSLSQQRSIAPGVQVFPSSRRLIPVGQAQLEPLGAGANKHR